VKWPIPFGEWLMAYVVELKRVGKEAEKKV
jgi:hypothetical protein